MSQRYQRCFEQLTQKKAGAFVPFVMLGDPDLALCKKIIKTLIVNGADALELGIPFSDPVADGPVIQKASIRALANGATVKKCLALVHSIRREYPEIPIGLLVYANLVVTHSMDSFYRQASAAGVDSVLIADVPVLESRAFIQAAKDHQIAPIFIATPNANEKTLQQVATLGEGYTYLLSRAGVTGTEVKAEMPVKRIIKTLSQHSAPPLLLGFGISSPAQVKKAIQSGAKGAISGSALVKVIAENLADEALMLDKLGQFVANMKQATVDSKEAD